jgi:hypothetical protein
VRAERPLSAEAVWKLSIWMSDAVSGCWNLSLAMSMVIS